MVAKQCYTLEHLERLFYEGLRVQKWRGRYVVPISLKSSFYCVTGIINGHLHKIFQKKNICSKNIENRLNMKYNWYI